MVDLQLANPKQTARVRAEGWYRYYAGYSPDFVADALRLVNRDARPLHVLDPWVGAGTTCAVAADQGHVTTGVDINPALVTIAKARMLRSDVTESMEALTEEIIKGANRSRRHISPGDPLLNWFAPKAATSLRALERSIFRLMVSPESDESALGFGLTHLSPLAAFFYVTLFRVTRNRLRSATTSNPTWVKASVPLKNRAKPSRAALQDEFRAMQGSLSEFLRIGTQHETADTPVEIQHGSSTSLNLPDEVVDVVITSPPYCTRIDYVASARPELAVLGCGDDIFKALRHMTIGSPTLPSFVDKTATQSAAAKRFLKAVRSHRSKASQTYYYRYFDTYFRMLDRSLQEMHRVVQWGGSGFLVVQDSYYKEIHLDLPRITTELAERHSWVVSNRFDYPVRRTMAVVNPRARAYRQTFGAVESVLLLRRS